MAKIDLKISINHFGLSLKKSNNLSTWSNLGIEPGGARRKIILHNPKDPKYWYLFKVPKYGAFEATTEIFNAILAQRLGINHVLYFPASYKGEKGVVCRSFIPMSAQEPSELWEMKDLVCRHSNVANLEGMFGRDDDVLKEHHLENIILILESEFGKTILPDFFRMVGFDALVGHGDRHWSNYGIIVKFAKNAFSAEFSPVYDTASGYLTEIIDSKRLENYLKNELQSDAWYCPNKKGLCKITLSGDIRVNHFDLMRKISTDPVLKKYFRYVEEPFRSFNLKLVKLIIKTFFGNLEPIRRDIIENILEKRHSLGMSILKEANKT